MKLADKPVYYQSGKCKIMYQIGNLSQNTEPVQYCPETDGITYKEALVLALASNPEMMVNDDKDRLSFNEAAHDIVFQADRIIKELEK